MPCGIYTTHLAAAYALLHTSNSFDCCAGRFCNRVTNRVGWGNVDWLAPGALSKFMYMVRQEGWHMESTLFCVKHTSQNSMLWCFQQALPGCRKPRDDWLVFPCRIGCAKAEMMASVGRPKFSSCANGMHGCPAVAVAAACG